MRRIHAWFALAICAVGAGCETPIGSGFEIWRYTTRNLFELPLDSRDDCVERTRNRREAQTAWKKVQAEHPEKTYSVYYSQGFQDGFADYLYAGGNGQPPVVPPWYYRRAAHETPEGIASTEDWFAGYRHGARAAKESGLREMIVVPVSLPGRASLPIFAETGGYPANSPAAVAGGASGAMLPPPRPVPPEELPLPSNDASEKPR